MLAAAGASKAELAEWMVGRKVEPARRGMRAAGELTCSLRGVGVSGAAVGLEGIDLELHAGEIVAIAGVAGNGQQALAELLFGLRAANAGRMELGGRVMAARPRDWVRAGVARIPEDRHAVGVVSDLPIWENAVLERFSTAAFSRAGVLRRGAAQAHARNLIERFDVRGTQAQGVSTPTAALSGGNMQKLILGRALTGDPLDPKPPRLIVADQPTWGLDIGAVAYVHQQLLDACAQGAAVLLISEDLDEIFAVADRVAVIHQGRLTPARPLAQWSLASIGLAMAGASEAGRQHAH
jgi:simple sugar transport system ATP-binding protein